jgi:hypothetical protein
MKTSPLEVKERDIPSKTAIRAMAMTLSFRADGVSTDDLAKALRKKQIIPYYERFSRHDPTATHVGYIYGSKENEVETRVFREGLGSKLEQRRVDSLIGRVAWYISKHMKRAKYFQKELQVFLAREAYLFWEKNQNLPSLTLVL